MHKHIRTVITKYEPITFLVAEPLHCAFELPHDYLRFHFSYLLEIVPSAPSDALILTVSGPLAPLQLHSFLTFKHTPYPMICQEDNQKNGQVDYKLYENNKLS